MANVNNKAANQPAHLGSLISAFIVHCLDNIVSIFAKPKIFGTLV